MLCFPFTVCQEARELEIRYSPASREQEIMAASACLRIDGSTARQVATQMDPALWVPWPRCVVKNARGWIVT